LKKDNRAGTFVAAVSKQMECAVARTDGNRVARCAIEVAICIRPENLSADRAADILRVWRRGFISMGVQNQHADHSIDFLRLQTHRNKNLTILNMNKRRKLASVIAK
jgi:hypothetical protein